jgi:hypothetical protein
MELILEDINSKIYTIRGIQVVLDEHFSQRVQEQEQNYIMLKQKYLIKQ